MRSGLMYVAVPTHDMHLEAFEARWPETPKSAILASPRRFSSRLESLMSLEN